MHAGLRPQEVSPAHIHLVKHRHVLRAQAEVPDLEVFLNAGGGHGLKHQLITLNWRRGLQMHGMSLCTELTCHRYLSQDILHNFKNICVDYL